MHYVKSEVYSKVSKRVKYNISANLLDDGFIEGTHCECRAGEGGFSRCKHVMLMLIGLSVFAATKKCILRKTCTQELQTFHRPKTSYSVSPVKASTSVNNKRKIPPQDPKNIGIQM